VEAAFLKEVNTQVSYLYGFARQVNELDFAVSLAGEFRGAQDAGWSTTITASEVYLSVSPFPRVATQDFNGDGYSDIAWRDISGDVAIWLMNGAQVSSSGGLGQISTVWSIVGQRDAPELAKITPDNRSSR
jgi:hypothetical protein